MTITEDQARELLFKGMCNRPGVSFNDCLWAINFDLDREDQKVISKVVSDNLKNQDKRKEKQND